jgi:hypothetical protein
MIRPSPADRSTGRTGIAPASGGAGLPARAGRGGGTHGAAAGRAGLAATRLATLALAIGTNAALAAAPELEARLPA